MNDTDRRYHYICSRGTRWLYSPLTPAQHARARTAYENEILATFIILALCRLVTLEKLHGDVIDFDNNDSLQPLPAERYRVKGVDLDDLAFANAIEDDLNEQDA